MPAKKKICGNCKSADKSKGVASWYCVNPEPQRDRECKTPMFFPRVFTNDKCIYFEKDNKDE